MSHEDRTYREDGELVRRSLSGDRHATARVLEVLQEIPSGVAGMNRRLGRPLTREEELEASQAALAASWFKLKTFAGRSCLRTWTHGVARTQVLRAVKDKAGLRRVDRCCLDGLVAPTVAPRDDLIDEVREAIEDQPAPRVEVLRLRLLEELSFEQIGERLGLSASAVKARYYRGLGDLRRSLRSSKAVSGSGR